MRDFLTSRAMPSFFCNRSTCEFKKNRFLVAKRQKKYSPYSRHSVSGTLNPQFLEAFQGICFSLGEDTPCAFRLWGLDCGFGLRVLGSVCDRHCSRSVLRPSLLTLRVFRTLMIGL